VVGVRVGLDAASYPLVGQSIEATPVKLSLSSWSKYSFLLMPLRLRSRDDSTRLVVRVGIDDGDGTTVGQPDGIPARLRIIETVIGPFESWPLEVLDRMLKRDFVKPKIPLGLVDIPSVSPGCNYTTYVA
jgi:hypothetical protein